MAYTDLMVKGQMNFMGIEIPVVSGGFGEDKMCVSDKTIAEIHGQPTIEIRRRINDNIKRFKDGIDIIDLKRMGDTHTLDLLIQLGYAKQSITQAQHVYILSERGYAKLIKIMDDDKSWEVHDKLVDDYFSMREQVPQLTRKEQLQLAILNGSEMERAEALKEYEEMVTAPLLDTIAEQEETITTLETTVEEQQPCVDYVDAVLAQQDSILVRELAKLAYTQGKIEIGERKLYSVLRYWGLVLKHSCEPSQKALNAGWLETDSRIIIKQTPYGQFESEQWTTRVTPKGQIYIIQRLIREQYTPEEIKEIHGEWS